MDNPIDRMQRRAKRAGIVAAAAIEVADENRDVSTHPMFDQMMAEVRNRLAAGGVDLRRLDDAAITLVVLDALGSTTVDFGENGPAVFAAALNAAAEVFRDV